MGRKTSDLPEMHQEPRMTSLGQAVSKKVREKVMSYEELAHAAGIDRKTIRNLLYGHHRPQAGTIRRLASALDISPTFFTTLLEANKKVEDLGHQVCSDITRHPSISVDELAAVYSGEQFLAFHSWRTGHVVVHELASRETDCFFEIATDALGRLIHHKCSPDSLTSNDMETLIETVRRLNPRWKPYNDPGLRLENISFNSTGKLSFKFVLTSYFDYVVSNLAISESLSIRERPLRKELEPGPILSTLSESPCGNITGVSCLVLTSDGWLVVCVRSMDVLTFPGMLGPSASGAMNFTDEAHVNPSASIFDKIRLEIREELGLSSAHLDTILYLGTTRDLEFGGKPEIFFLVGCKATRTELVELQEYARDTHETASIDFLRVTNEGISDSWLYDEGTELVGSNACSSLRANVLLAARYFDNIS